MAWIDIEFGREILQESDPEAAHQKLLEMEMVLQNSSYGHEYTMLELQEAGSFLEQEALHGKLEDFKQDYFHARQYLMEHYPERLQEIETALMAQKSSFFNAHTA
jgi:hypothetical protein